VRKGKVAVGDDGDGERGREERCLGKVEGVFRMHNSDFLQARRRSVELAAGALVI